MAKRYWHFLQSDKRLQYEPRTKVKVGQTLKYAGPLVLCHSGLHASHRAIDALRYAPGPIVCRVTLGGGILEGDDKACTHERTVLWMADATETLHRFACKVALDALKAHNVTDQRYYAAIETKLRWLEGKATDAELDAASDAAWAAARAAAWAAARDAAWGAARGAQNKILESMLRRLAP